jgi:uncharacterized membrane protein (DUF373 family)
VIPEQVTGKQETGEQAGEGDHGGDSKSTSAEDAGGGTQRRFEKAQRGAQREDAVARVTAVGLHLLEDFIYVLTALVLVGGSFVVLGQAVFRLVTETTDGVIKALEHTMESLLIVFILVELLSATRSAIDEHRLVAEPFLLVGILAAIKETVVLATFRIESGKTSDAVAKIAALGGLVIAMAVATWILRRREREPKESGD